MNSLVRKFFQSGAKEGAAFRDVLFLQDVASLSWEEALLKAPELPRGWYELSRVQAVDRIEFIRDFWLDRIPYHPLTHPAIADFFDQLDDVGVVLTRQMDEEQMNPELVYSLKDHSCFFRGNPPCTEQDLLELKSEIGLNLPNDFLAFHRLHSGFGKLSDMGLLSIGEIAEARRRILQFILYSEKSLCSGKQNVDPMLLIPFYEFSGMASYQCFYGDWYPGSEMGNVYLSGIDYTISDTTDKKAWIENLAFPTFSEWLTYYLHGMNLAP